MGLWLRINNRLRLEEIGYDFIVAYVLINMEKVREITPINREKV